MKIVNVHKFLRNYWIDIVWIVFVLVSLALLPPVPIEESNVVDFGTQQWTVVLFLFVGILVLLNTVNWKSGSKNGEKEISNKAQS